MYSIRVIGGNKLNGEVNISTAKNSVLPIMASAILADGESKILRIPALGDVITMTSLLRSLGAGVTFKGDDVLINPNTINNFMADYEIVSKMRASICVLGPLLARFGVAKISLPGGCALGTRPVDMHIFALEKLGAEIKIDHGYIIATAANGLRGAEINFDKVSVGATENAIAAAVLAKGTTIIRNPALEPEVIDLAHMLQKMGAKIEGLGTKEITIEGVDRLNPVEYTPIPDRIEAGTYMVAAAITGGNLRINHIVPNHLSMLIDKLRLAGVKVETGKDFVIVSADKNNILPVNVETREHPGFHTDLQAQFMALMLVANGESSVTENIFENRFMHVAELKRFGADITIDGRTAHIKGGKKLYGAKVMATDLRASVSLVLAALTIGEESEISRVYHLDRGYEHFEKKLQACGANIVRVKVDA